MDSINFSRWSDSFLLLGGGSISVMDLRAQTVTPFGERLGRYGLMRRRRRTGCRLTRTGSAYISCFSGLFLTAQRGLVLLALSGVFESEITKSSDLWTTAAEAVVAVVTVDRVFIASGRSPGQCESLGQKYEI